MAKMIRISMAGDTMLGRLVDQMMPIHVESDAEEEQYVRDLKAACPALRMADQKYPFGNLLPIFQQQSDLNILNLETSITRDGIKWPKTFNYRMHPENTKILTCAKIDYVSLANNHTLDYGGRGLLDTMDSLSRERILFAGVGKNAQEARRPKFKQIKGITFAFLSASDHPASWKAIPEFHYLDTTHPDIEDLKNGIRDARERSDFVVYSFHWGPNYQWFPDANIRNLARLMIDYGVDLVHGHSAHHIQGVEIYKGRPIFYGCGDFVDDYAVNWMYRNDLGFLYRLEYEVEEDNTEARDRSSSTDSDPTKPPSEISTFSFFHFMESHVPKSRKSLILKKLYMIPTRIYHMQVNRTMEREEIRWLYSSMTRLCHDMGTIIRLDVDDDALPVLSVDLSHK